MPRFLRRLLAGITKLFLGPLLPVTKRIPGFVLRPFARMIDPQSFAADVAGMSDEQLAALLSGQMRTLVLDEIVNRMPEQFRPEHAGDTNAVFRFELSGGAGKPDVYNVTVRDGACASGRGAPDDATLRIELDALDFLKLASGKENGVQLYMSGRLKTEGNFALLARLQSMFEIPTPATASAG